MIEARGIALSAAGRLLFEGLDLRWIVVGEHLTGPNGSGNSSLIRRLPAADPGRRNHRPGKAALADEHLALDRELPLGGRWLSGTGPGWATRWPPSISCAGRRPVQCCRPAQERACAPGAGHGDGAPLWCWTKPITVGHRGG